MMHMLYSHSQEHTDKKEKEEEEEEEAVSHYW
jgi:hypothetical protein